MKHEINAPPPEALTDTELGQVVGGAAGSAVGGVIGNHGFLDRLELTQPIPVNHALLQAVAEAAKQAAQPLAPVYTPFTDPNDVRSAIFIDE